MDPTIQQKIFAGESGGDYDALFGFSNRPGSRYENVKLTDMTINEADQFADPSGEYGQWVKSQVGRVATPMGAYQIVGTTLRDAKRALGLTGDERMTREMQDRLGEYILQTQGTGAWEGYGKGGPVVSSQGGGDMDPQAFLEGFDEMLKPTPRAKAGQALQNFGALTTAFGRNEAAPAILPGDRMMARHEAKQGRNQTAAWLKSQGHNDMANAVLGGQMTGGDAMRLIYAQRAAVTRASGGATYGKSPQTAMKDGVPTPFTVGDDGSVKWLDLDGATLATAGWVKVDTATGTKMVNPRTLEEVFIGDDFEEGKKRAGREKQDAAIKGYNRIAPVVEGLLNHPGMADAVGGLAGNIDFDDPLALQQATLTEEAKDFIARHDQLKGKVFLEAINDLRGTGPITDREGAAATAAYGRMNRATTPEAYMQALQDYVTSIDKMIKGYEEQSQGIRPTQLPMPDFGGGGGGDDPLGIRE